MESVTITIGPIWIAVALFLGIAIASAAFFWVTEWLSPFKG